MSFLNHFVSVAAAMVFIFSLFVEFSFKLVKTKDYKINLLSC